MKQKLLFIILAVLFAGQAFGQRGFEEPTVPGETLVKGGQSSYDLLFIGNSHSSANGLPGLVTTLIKAGNAQATAASGVAQGYKFLDDRLNDGETLQSLESRQWSHVFLQAQKYSSTGLYYYSTDAAEEWIRRVKSKDARPILFPEWPRRGNTEEGQRIHDLHLSISSREAACVAPVGLAWEASIASSPEIELHAPDGNHSNLNGALLTAYVFYQLLTEQPATGLPYVSSINVNAGTQQKLKTVANDVVLAESSTCGGTTVSDATVPGIPALNIWGILVLVLSLGLFSQQRV